MLASLLPVTVVEGGRQTGTLFTTWKQGGFVSENQDEIPTILETAVANGNISTPKVTTTPARLARTMYAVQR